MNLRKKTLIVVGSFLVCLIVILYIAAQVELLISFSDLEERNARTDMERALNAISNELTSLGDLANYWAARNDTYDFMATGDPGFINYNIANGSLTNDSLRNMEINLILFLDSYGQIVFSRYLNVSGREEELPQNLIEQMSLYGFCPGCLDKQSRFSGIILLSHQPMLIVTQPITNSRRNLHSMGRVVLGRYLTQKEVGKLSDVTQLNLTIFPLSDAQMPEDFREIRSQLSYGSPVLIKSISRDSIAGYALLMNIYGNPLLILRADAPREIYGQGARSMESFVILFSAAGLIFLILTLMYLDRSVLSRLIGLAAGVTAIGRTPNTSICLRVEGEDELAHLATSINDMLAALDRAHQDLSKSERRYRAVVEDQPDLICRYLSDGTITFVNDAFCNFFSRKAEEIAGKRIDQSAFKGQMKSAKELVSELSVNHPSITYESQMSTSEGLRWLLWTSRGIFDESGSLLEVQSVGKEITDTKIAEEARRESEERYRLISENMTDAIHLHNPDPGFTFVYASPSFKIVGYDPAELIGRSPFEFMISPEDIGLVKQAASKIFASKSQVVTEYRAMTRDGSMIWIETMANPILDSSGNTAYVVCSSRDISERKRAEEARKKSEERYRLIAENMTDVIHLHSPDPKMRYVYVSPSIKQAGYDPSELIGTSPFEMVIFPEDAEVVKQSYNDIVGHKSQIVAEYRARLKDGSLLWVETTASPILDPNGNVIYIVCSTRDITLRKKAEEARKESEERYRLITENMSEVIFLSTPDPDMRYAYVSPSVKQAGYNPSELIGRSPFEIFIIEPEDIEVVKQSYNMVVNQKSRNVSEYRIRIRDGSRAWVETTANPILDVEGNLIYILGSSRDITMRKRAEEALKESQAQMADIISFLPDAIMAIDLNGSVMIWNRAMEILTGVKAKDMLGKGDYEYSLPFYGYKRPILVDMVLKPHDGFESEYLGFKREESAVVGEVFIPTFGPHGSYLLAKATALYDEIGNIVGAIESVRDMTERRLMEQKLERSRTELHVAAEIQKSFIPRRTPEIPNFDVAAVTIPAMEVGGDFYDFISLPEGSYGLVIADVAGKSIPAALFMALSRMIVRASATHQSQAAEVLKNANNMIALDATAGMFVTLLYGVLDGEALTLSYANAGHPPPLLFRSRDCRYVEEGAAGIALGAKEDVAYEERTIKFDPGDVAVFYTDGVTEAMNTREELYGPERLTSAVNKSCQSSAKEIMGNILREIAEFREGQEQNDDITLVVLKASTNVEKHSEITVSARDEEIPRVTAHLEKIMSGAGFDSKGILEMQLALEEACNNIVRHGYKGVEGDIQIVIDIEADQLSLAIEDSALRFDPVQFNKPELTDDIEQRPIGGLGIHLIKSLVDEMKYEFQNGKNRLILIKKAR